MLARAGQIKPLMHDRGTVSIRTCLIAAARRYKRCGPGRWVEGARSVGPTRTERVLSVYVIYTR